MKDIKSCPFCGGNDIRVRAFAISPDASIGCADCGAMIEIDVPWTKEDTVETHDARALETLVPLWNTRALEAKLQADKAELVECIRKMQEDLDCFLSTKETKELNQYIERMEKT